MSRPSPEPGESFLVDPVSLAVRFDHWRAEYRKLATERDLGWLAGRSAELLRAAFESGIEPLEELDMLASMAEWRGCGCGGA